MVRVDLMVGISYSDNMDKALEVLTEVVKSHPKVLADPPPDIKVTNLGESNFRVFEDGQPVDVRYFRQEDVPVSIGILVDNSGSMRNKRQRVNAAQPTQ